MNIAILGLAIAFIYIWCETDGPYEWANLLRLPFPQIKEYYKAKKNLSLYGSMSFHNYLLTYRNNFFTRLITCPVCLAVWVNIIFSIFWLEWQYLGVNIVLTWMGYFLLRRLAKE